MDIEFGTDGWRTTREEFTDPRIRAVGQAVADYLRASDRSGTVAVGYDPREGSRSAAEELCRVLCANGFDALIPDRDTPTPVVAWTVRNRDIAGALQVTASHNPAAYNGIKFIPEGGAPALPAVTDRLADNLREPVSLPESEWGTVIETDFLEPYLDHALDFVETDLAGLTVAHDAMHGSGRGVTDELLARAGADVVRLRADRDPEFGGGSPEPSAARLRDLESRVQDGEAVLGIANDGDSDRIAVVTPERGVVDANWLFVALYDSLLEEEILEGEAPRASDASSAERSSADHSSGQSPREDGERSEPRGGDAVRTVSTTYLVDRVAAAHGHAVHETPVGFKWVAEAMADHDALVGGEESGGFGVRGHLRNKDGVLVALLVAAAHSEEPLDDRLDRLRDAYGDIAQDRISVDCPDDRKETVIDSLDGSLPDRVAGVEIESVNDTDGFKMVLDDGSWLLVRPSGTEPKLRVYAEAESRERVEELLEAGKGLVRPLI